MNQKLCECGCGQAVSIAKLTDNRRGVRAGEFRRFVAGHPRLTWGEHLWRVEDCGFTTPCWIWLRARKEHGYGIFANPDRISTSRLAHREAYEREYGLIPPGHELDHLCKQPPCVRPDHLEAVTHAQNMQRGRKAKLTAEQVREIRALHKPGTPVYNRDLGERFGVSHRTIAAILKGQSWQ